jgi:DNA modification methylase
MIVENINISEIVEYDRNPRKNDHVVDKVAAAIAEYGFRVPLLVKREANTIKLIDGHLRLKAAKKLNLQNAPCIFVDDMSDAKIKAFRLSINKMAELADWDEELLALELKELAEMDFDLELTGFDLSEIEALFPRDDKIGLIDDDESPALTENSKSKEGDIWICGNHRIMCGDFRNDEHRENLLKNNKADMVFTDPPYNANYSSRVDVGRRKEWGGIENDNMSDSEYNIFLKDIFSGIKKSIKENCSLYVCIDWKSYPSVQNNAKDFNHKSTIIWDKGHFALGTYYRTQYEMILFLSNGDKILWNAGHDERDVWDIPRDAGVNYIHPTQKPVAIPERAILNSSNKNDIVLDAFCGSGSTLIACEKNDRICYTIDIDSRYVDAAVKRWQEFTGAKAIHASTGKTFDES